MYYIVCILSIHGWPEAKPAPKAKNGKTDKSRVHVFYALIYMLFRCFEASLLALDSDDFTRFSVLVIPVQKWACAYINASFMSVVSQTFPWKAVFSSLSTSRYSWLSRFTGVHYTTTTLPPKPDEEISASCLSPLSRQPISERAAGARFVEKLK